MEKLLKKKINYVSENPIRAVVFLHSFLFFSILFFVLLYFHGDLISTVWASFKNDSWKFIRNTIEIENPPYPYHLITTSFHFFPLYIIFSTIFQPNLSLTLSVILIQYTFSLLTVILVFQIYKDSFDVNNGHLILFIWIIDTTVFSLFFISATAEILFIFYQTLTWFLFMRKKYFFSSITLGMTLALRFNGFFFVFGFLVIIFSLLIKNRKEIISNKFKMLLFSFYLFFSFITSIIPFIYSLLVANDFFLPFNSEFNAYSTWETYIVNNQIIMVPFTFWINYISWVITTNGFIEYLLFTAALITFFLGLCSIIVLYRFRKQVIIEKVTKIDFLLILALINFLGVNTIVSGRNFSRFLSFTFPIYPIVLYLILKLQLNNKRHFLLGILFFGFAIILNFVWWLNIDFCGICVHNF